MNEAKLRGSLALGVYVKATFDSAASRGVLTQSSIATMINSLIAMYGDDQFTVGEAKPPATDSVGSIAAAARARTSAMIEKTKQQVEEKHGVVK